MRQASRQSKRPEFTEREEKVFAYLMDAAKKSSAIQSLILFGSRARRDHRDRSDYDIAVNAPRMTDTAWAKWALDVKEGAPTLCGVDLVRMSKQVSMALVAEVKSEGVTIYSKGGA